MGAHAGTIGIRTGQGAERPRRRLAQIRDAVRQRRRERARRAHTLRASGARASYVPGSEHSHLLQRPRGF